MEHDAAVVIEECREEMMQLLSKAEEFRKRTFRVYGPILELLKYNRFSQRNLDIQMEYSPVFRDRTQVHFYPNGSKTTEPRPRLLRVILDLESCTERRDVDTSRLYNSYS